MKMQKLLGMPSEHPVLKDSLESKTIENGLHDEAHYLCPLSSPKMIFQ